MQCERASLWRAHGVAALFSLGLALSGLLLFAGIGIYWQKEELTLLVWGVLCCTMFVWLQYATKSWYKKGKHLLLSSVAQPQPTDGDLGTLLVMLGLGYWLGRKSDHTDA